MSHRRRPFFLPLAVAIAAFLALSSLLQAPAGAQDDTPPATEFSIEPTAPEGVQPRSWFVYEMQPGQIFQDSVDIKNHTDREVTLALYSTDAFSLPGSGTFTGLNEGSEASGAGTWVTLPDNQITLQGLQGATVPFQVEVPIDAVPGDHAAVIFASDPIGIEGDPESDINLTIRTRVGARVYVRVAGPLEPSLRVDDITVWHQRPRDPRSEGVAIIRYVVTNTGNIRLSESIQVKVNGLFGRNLKTLEPRDFPDVLPGSSIVVTEVVDGLGAWEPLTAEVIASSPQVTVSRTKTFYPIPWPTVIAIGTVLVLLAVWWWLRRRRRRTEQGEDDPLLDEPDGPTEPDVELVGADQ